MRYNSKFVLCFTKYGQNSKSDLQGHLRALTLMLSACVLVNTVAKSGSSNTAVTYGLCGLDVVRYYLRTPCLWRAPHQTALQERLDAFLNELESLVFVMQYYTMAELLDKADARLFSLVQRPDVEHLLSDTINSCSMDLRHRGRSFSLPQYNYNLYKNSFISRCLFKYV